MKPRETGHGKRDTWARLVGIVLITFPVSRFSFPVLHAQQRPTYQQQMQENQRRLEGIRRERSEVEQELARLRTQAHSLADEIANIEQQKSSTNRIVNELDRQITGFGRQIDQITVDLLIAQDALLEKRAVLERRLVDIYKRGALYSWQVLLAAESFGDLLSRYKYLFLVSRQDRLLTNDMHKLRDRVARQRQLLVDSREALGRRRRERTDELGRYLALERARETNLRETRRSTRQAEERLSRLERDERSLNDRIETLERARREAESRGVTTATGAITTADLGNLDWPVDVAGGGRIIYPFGTTIGPNNTRIPRHGIGIKAPVGTAVRAVAPGTVSLAGSFGLYLTSVLLDHGGGYYTFYAYLNDATVRQGDRVVRGQLIGHVGGESSDEGPHLHFEIRGQGGIALDPGNWLRPPRPRR
jgi:septal ring factor EnvC (AmiA/AmiB activator)